MEGLPTTKETHTNVTILASRASVRNTDASHVQVYRLGLSMHLLLCLLTAV